MAPMYPTVSRTRRLWILGAVALPFLGLLFWSGLLIQSTRAASLGGEVTVAKSDRGWTEVMLKIPPQGAP